MKITPNYQNSAFIVPGAVLEHLEESRKSDLKVLLYILGTAEFSVTTAAETLKMTEEEFISSIHFWEENDIITAKILSKSKLPKSKSTRISNNNNVIPSKQRKKLSASSLPSYTTEETARFLENNKETATLIDTCEHILGKIFSTAETNIIIGMLDHLSLSSDYIMLLCAHAANHGKKSVRYIEKLAINFSDRDIFTYAELEEELARIEISEGAMVSVRKLFGIGKRAFTPKEREMIYNWCAVWHFNENIIQKAYEITVNNTNEASIPYANAVLENWFNSGLTTLEEINASLIEHKKNKDSDSNDMTSFDTDDFFEAALKRSYGE